MEGGTDFDLQVLEAQIAAAASSGEASGGEKSQGPSGGNAGGQAGAESTVSPAEETTSSSTAEPKDQDKVGAAVPCGYHMNGRRSFCTVHSNIHCLPVHEADWCIVGVVVCLLLELRHEVSPQIEGHHGFVC